MNRRDFTKISALSLVGVGLSGFALLKNFGANKIKVGQIGTAHSHAEEKYTTIKKLHEVFEVVGVVENDETLRQAAMMKPEYANANWITEEKLFSTPGLRAILVETDFPGLLTTAVRCINRGYHVHIDKPPGKSIDGLTELLNTARAKNLVVQQGYMFRYNPAFQLCIDLVEKGVIGEIFEVHGVISKKINSKRRKSLADTYGGGMMLLGCHLIDMMVKVCGKPERISTIRKQSNIRNDLLYDNELAVFDYPNSSATIRSTLLEVEGMKRRQFVVCGKKGTIEIKPLEPPKIKLTLEKPVGNYSRGINELKLPAVSGRYDEQLIDFAQQIKGERETEYSREHDLAVHETLLKACEIN